MGINLRDFELWLSENLSRRYARDLLQYAKKFYPVLLKGDASIILRMSKGKRRMVMSSLANLAKFWGIYDRWKNIVKRYDLKWEGTTSLETFLSIFNTNLKSVKSWLVEIIPKLPRDYALLVIFIALTGVRGTEACNSLRLISDLHERDELDHYLDEELLILEHFRFPNIFLRRSKKLFISFVTQNLLDIILQEGRIKPNYATLYTKLRRMGYPNKTHMLRKLYATTLRNNGLPSELIDILQGRVSSSIFIKFYYKPLLMEMRNKVMSSIEPLEKELLSLL